MTTVVVDHDDKILVRAKFPKKEDFGWYGGKRTRNGEQFYLFAPEDFSHNWMEVVRATPELLKQIPPKPEKPQKKAGGK